LTDQYSARTILRSPDYYPVRIDLQKGTISFLRMSRGAYRESVFLDARTKHLGPDAFEIRLNDLQLAATARARPTPVHFIFNTSFCCSTLLARHFEAQPECFVLKEPVLLAQLAVAPERGSAVWNEALDLSFRLLARTYAPGDIAVIKPNEWCNVLAPLLLRKPGTTATLLSAPVRDFLLTVLRNEERRGWIRKRIGSALEDGRQHEALAGAGTHAGPINDARAGAYIWALNRCRFRRLMDDPVAAPRVATMDGNALARAPDRVLPEHFGLCGVRGSSLDRASNAYSKGPQRTFGASDRESEIAELDRSLGPEVDDALAWAVSAGLGEIIAI